MAVGKEGGRETVRKEVTLGVSDGGGSPVVEVQLE